MKKAFLLAPSSENAEEQQLRFVKQAERAGVKHLIKLSQLAADKQSPVRFLRCHAMVEEANGPGTSGPVRGHSASDDAGRTTQNQLPGLAG